MSSSGVGWTVLQGDSRELVPLIPDASVDALVTDPPAGIGFMKEWDRMSRGDYICLLTGVFYAAFRALKPGAHGVVWAIPRTSHVVATCLEGAGFEVRDIIHALFGQGMPKSKDLGGGMGSALKPACEHWILVRKPCVGSITANFASHGTGGLNINACRVSRASDDVPGWHTSGARGSNGYHSEKCPDCVGGERCETCGGTGWLKGAFVIRDMSPEEIQARCGDKGRWPPNVVLSEGADQLIDQQSGHRKGSGKTGMVAYSQPNIRGGRFNDATTRQVRAGMAYGDSGGASRYFPSFGYFPKPGRAEKEAGLEAIEAAILNRVNPGGLEREPRFAPIEVKNNHPTVKSVALMRWLCRLVSPPGGIILDPFCGSGSTGVSAIMEGCRFIGIEAEARYCDIASARMSHWEEQ